MYKKEKIKKIRIEKYNYTDAWEISIRLGRIQIIILRWKNGNCRSNGETER